MNRFFNALKRYSRAPIEKIILALMIGVLLALLPGSVGSADPQVINLKISGEMPDDRHVASFDASPDGNWAVFIADRDAYAKYELFSVPMKGGEVVKLNGPLVAGGDVGDNGGSFSNVAISEDSQWVVYLVDQEVDEQYELYRAPIGGGEAVKLSRPLSPLERVTNFRVAPDSETVVYRVYASGVSNGSHFYNVGINGGASTWLSDPENDCPRASSIKISPDSQWVVYDRILGGGYEDLYRAPISGGGCVQLNISPTNDRSIVQYDITPDSSRVVYISNQDRIDADELYSVLISGGGNIKLHSNFPGGRTVERFMISPDGQRVVYRADQAVYDQYELYSTRTATGGPVRLNPDLVANGDVRDDYRITPNSQGVVFRADDAIDEVDELFSAYIDGSAYYRLHPALTAGEEVSAFRITPNSLGVVYRAKIDNPYNQLYSIYINGTSRTPLTSVSSSDVNLPYYFQITPNNLGVAYVADLDTDEVDELYSVPSTGGSTVKWSVPIQIANGGVGRFILLPDSQSVLYEANPEQNIKVELFYAFWGYQIYLPLAQR